MWLSNLLPCVSQSLRHPLLRHQVLLRALRDFNLGKLTADDTSIFMGLLNDLFPKTLELVPRAIDHKFEEKVGKEAPFRLNAFAPALKPPWVVNPSLKHRTA